MKVADFYEFLGAVLHKDIWKLLGNHSRKCSGWYLTMFEAIYSASEEAKFPLKNKEPVKYFPSFGFIEHINWFLPNNISFTF